MTKKEIDIVKKLCDCDMNVSKVAKKQQIGLQRKSKDVLKTEVFMGCPRGGMSFSAKRKMLDTMK